mgnify:CR=1 FL=1|tara:strand:- start:3953 stop:4165 length:213 start_codon:yes stop_codon:yes gene_type:complete
MIDIEDIEKFKDLSDTITNSIKDLEDKIGNTNLEDKSFFMSSLSSIKNKIENGGDLNEEIQKLKAHASNK